MMNEERLIREYIKDHKRDPLTKYNRNIHTNNQSSRYLSNPIQPLLRSEERVNELT
jgi:ABC-type transporter lipoprotein component MlaA